MTIMSCGRTAARSLAALALTISPAAALLAATPAHAEPSVCAGKWGSDSSHGSSWGVVASGYPAKAIQGIWYNCSGPGDDRVRMNIAWATDGPCITIRYGENRSSYETRGWLVGIEPEPYYDGFYRC